MPDAKDKLHFKPGTDPKAVAAFLQRMVAGETAEQIRTSERGKQDSPVVTSGYVVEGAEKAQ